MVFPIRSVGMTKTRKLTLLSLLIAQALVLHIMERLLPVPVPVPGVKLGLANIITLITIILFGLKDAIIVVIMRIFLGSLLGGNFLSFLFSLAGGLLSTLVMAWLYKRWIKFFSIPAISILGAVFHNLGQIAVASLVIANLNVFFYLPVLIFSGVITGLFIGLIVRFAYKPLLQILQSTGDLK